MSDIDSQIAALGHATAALDDGVIESELAEIEGRMAVDQARAGRLRAILQFKQALGVPAENGTRTATDVAAEVRPRTRDAIVAFFNTSRAPHNVREIREHLSTRGISISAEGVRQHLRRLAGDGELDGPHEGYYQLALLLEEDQ